MFCSQRRARWPHLNWSAPECRHQRRPLLGVVTSQGADVCRPDPALVMQLFNKALFWAFSGAPVGVSGTEMRGWSLGTGGSETRLKLTFPSELRDGYVPVKLRGVRCFCCVCALTPPSWILSSRRAENVSDSYFLFPAKPGTVPGPQ